MDLSLDEIIKNGQIRRAPSKKFANDKRKASLRRSLKPTPILRQQLMRDARLKIIKNNRARIRDARDKIVEIARTSGDARQRLLRKQYIASSSTNSGIYRNGQIGNGMKNFVKQAPFARPYRNSTFQRSRRPEMLEIPRGYIDYDNMDRLEEEEYAAASHLSRTVTNDEMDHYSSYPDTRDADAIAINRKNSWNTVDLDPFDVYDIPVNARTERNVSHVITERDLSPTPPPPKDILRPSARQRSPNEGYERRYVPESSSHLSYEMRSRLQHAPDPHASMGIFAKEFSSTTNSGYRIVVSNLHNSVSQSDIRELFADIGELYESRIVRPGVAEVLYKSLTDAEKAVDTYHNRQLDGLPMKCLLVNPRASSKPTAPAAKGSSAARHTSGKTPLEIDIDALHKVLFRRQ